MSPDVSVLMAARNPRTAYPEGLFASVIAALARVEGPVIELCLVNDASDDGVGIPHAMLDTLSLVRQASHSERRGPAAAYQSAAELATGRYCILQSVRSWYEPGALRDMARYLDRHPRVGFVYGDTQYYGAMHQRHVPPRYRAKDFDRKFMSLFGVMFRREAFELGCHFEEIGAFDGIPLDVCDYDFVLQMIKRLGWKGHKLKRLVLNYHYSGEDQQTDHMLRHAEAVHEWLYRRWGIRASVVG